MKRSTIKVYDAHLHMGHLSDADIMQPFDVQSFIQSHNVSGGAIMPTASIGGNDDFNLHLDLYKKASFEGLMPILYITPNFLECIKGRYDIASLKFLGIKIHPDAVEYDRQSLELVIKFAHRQNFPIFIHTGGKESCESIRFEYVIKKFPYQTFVLCHARPSDQAFYLLDKYPNVWVDTAFLPIEDLQCLISEKNEKRILFGTDFPVNRWYPDLPCEDKWYEMQVADIQKNLPATMAENVLCNNYMRFKKQYTNSLNLNQLC